MGVKFLHLFCSWKYGKVVYFSKIKEMFPCIPDCPNSPKLQIHFGKLAIQASLYVSWDKKVHTHSTYKPENSKWQKCEGFGLNVFHFNRINGQSCLNTTPLLLPSWSENKGLEANGVFSAAVVPSETRLAMDGSSSWSWANKEWARLSSLERLGWAAKLLP